MIGPEGGRRGEADVDAAAAALGEWRFLDLPRPPRRPPRPAASAADALRLSAREMRLVLTVLFVVFLTAEAWQVFGRLGGVRYTVLIATCAVLAAALGALAGRAEARAALAQGAPRGRAVPAPARAALVRRLRRRAWFETVVVGLAVSAGFLGLGVLVVDEELTRAWAAVGDDPGLARVSLVELWQGGGGDRLGIATLPGSSLVVSEPLLRLVGVLGALAALVFAVEVLLDDDLRGDVTRDLLADWAEARAAWEHREAAAPEEPRASAREA